MGNHPSEEPKTNSNSLVPLETLAADHVYGEAGQEHFDSSMAQTVIGVVDEAQLIMQGQQHNSSSGGVQDK